MLFRSESVESSGPVLKLAQAFHVIDPVPEVFDMSVKHSGVAV